MKALITRVLTTTIFALPVTFGAGDLPDEGYSFKVGGLKMQSEDQALELLSEAKRLVESGERKKAIELLQDICHSGWRFKAAKALAAIPEARQEAIAAFVTVINMENFSDTIMAALALAAIPEAKVEAIKAFGKIVDTGDVFFILKAAKALANIPGAEVEVVDALMKIIGSKNPEYTRYKSEAFTLFLRLSRHASASEIPL